MTKRQKAILVGSTLGDGYIFENRHGSSYWEVKQQAQRHKYIQWLYREFRALCGTPPTYRSDTLQWRFITRTVPEFTPWRRVFYGSGRKTVPPNISELLTNPLSLAVWYMDDGTRDYRPKDHYAFTLSTNAFSDDEQALLVNALWNNFKITTRMHKPKSRSTRYGELYIGREGRMRFAELVRRHILPCFSDKMPLEVTPQRLISL